MIVDPYVTSFSHHRSKQGVNETRASPAGGEGRSSRCVQKGADEGLPTADPRGAGEACEEGSAGKGARRSEAASPLERLDQQACPPPSLAARVRLRAALGRLQPGDMSSAADATAYG